MLCHDEPRLLPSHERYHELHPAQPKDGKKEYLTIEELRTLMATDSYRPIRGRASERNAAAEISATSG